MSFDLASQALPGIQKVHKAMITTERVDNHLQVPRGSTSVGHDSSSNSKLPTYHEKLQLASASASELELEPQAQPEAPSDQCITERQLVSRQCCGHCQRAQLESSAHDTFNLEFTPPVHIIVRVRVVTTCIMFGASAESNNLKIRKTELRGPARGPGASR
jgi:hypothetical protein